MGLPCTFGIAFEMDPRPAHGMIFFFFTHMRVISRVIWALAHGRHSMGFELGLSEPAVVSAVAVEIVTSCPAELTDVEIYLDANHAANRSTGLPATEKGVPAGLAALNKAIHKKHSCSATQSSFVVFEDCSWIIVTDSAWMTLQVFF